MYEIRCLTNPQDLLEDTVSTVLIVLTI